LPVTPSFPTDFHKIPQPPPPRITVSIPRQIFAGIKSQLTLFIKIRSSKYVE
jgi:hypothetical protein